LLLLAGTAAASDWYVDDNGSTTGDGSAGNPFQTINAALLAAVDGDRIHVAAGDYKEHLDIAASVALVGDPAGGTTIESPPLPRAIEIAASASVWLSDLTITRSGIINDFGGGLLNRGNLIAYRCRITQCTAEAVGGYPGGTLVTAGGGGLSNLGALLMFECSVEQCSVPFFDPANHSPHDGYGGGIHNLGSIKLLGCTIAENTCGTANLDASDSRGGGIYSEGPMHLRNTTVSGNVAQGSIAIGGGIATGADALIEFSTLTRNRAWADAVGDTRIASGGGVSGNAVVGHSVIAGNDVDTDTLDPGDGEDFYGSCDLRGYVLVQHPDCTTFVGDKTGLQTYVDPLLDVLADNGGEVRTHALLAGSPCIDTGTPDPLESATADARGFPRALWDPSVGPADLGSFELSGAPAFLFAASPSIPLPVGAVVALTTGGGIYAQPLVTAVISVSGAPMFIPVIVGAFDRTGISYVEADVPPGLSGLSVAMRSYSLDAKGKLIVSNVDTLDFQ
jgi:hypothetical protein